MNSTSLAPPDAARDRWQQANDRYLGTLLERLRVLVERRVLWMRHCQQDDDLRGFSQKLISDAQIDALLAQGGPRAEAEFYRSDAGAQSLSEELSRLDHELALQRAAAAAAPPAVEQLAALFGLSRFEKQTLVLCLALERDTSFERLVAYLHDDLNRKYVTVDLARKLFACADGAGRGLSPESPLRRFLLLEVPGGRQTAPVAAARPLQIPERVADYLCGVNRPDPAAADLLHPLADPVLTGEHDRLAERLAQWLATSHDRGEWPLLNLCGERGSGKRNVAGAACQRAGFDLREIRWQRIAATGWERTRAVRLLQREALLLQTAYYLDATELDASPANAGVALRDLVEDLGGMVVLGSREPCRWRAGLSVAVPKPNGAEQVALWSRVLGDDARGLNGQLRLISHHFDFGPRRIVDAAADARARAALRAAGPGAGITAEDLWSACRDRAATDLEDLAQRITTNYTWDDLVLPDDVVQQLREIAMQAKNRPRVYDVWGFGPQLTRGRGITALFSGASGTGKTMAAEVLGRTLELDVFRIDLAGVVSKYIGETERHLRTLFDAAEQSGAMALFFDEAEALFGARSEVRDSHDRYANIEVNYLLQRMEDYRGLAILATNRKTALDRAFLRRLRFLVDFPFPDARHRRRIWQNVFPAAAPRGKLDYDALARLEIAGGNIRNIALNAAFLAAEEDRPIEMQHILYAARREYAKCEKAITEAEFGQRRTM